MAIKFDNKAPEWDNVGAEPDAELKKGGFLAGYKPPAAYFNWFFNRTYECVKELQEKLVSSLKSLAFKDKVGDDDITAVAANKVTQDSKHRMITDAERSTWNGKADASGGDVSEMTVKTLGTITTEFPVPVAGESTKTFLGKVKKFFEDTKNWMTGVCLIGQIVNNCVTNNAKLPLSAAQGKVLMDLYTVLNTKITNNGIVDSYSGDAVINLDWVRAGTVVYKVLNGTCFVDFDITVKAITAVNTLIVSGLPTSTIVRHGRIAGWENGNISMPFYLNNTDIIANPCSAGRYAGCFSFSII